MSESVVFLGDIKGTKAALETYKAGGKELLEQRIEHLHDVFGRSFMRFRDKSRSMRGITFSDSVIAYWTDVAEALRFAIPFTSLFWRTLDHDIVRLRGFLDYGPHIEETSTIASALGADGGRFIRVIPTGIAVWSVAVAESSHFPDGLYASDSLAASLPAESCEAERFAAGPFIYRPLRLAAG